MVLDVTIPLLIKQLMPLWFQLFPLLLKYILHFTEPTASIIIAIIIIATVLLKERVETNINATMVVSKRLL